MNKKYVEDKKFEELTNDTKKILKEQTKVVATIQYKKSQEIVFAKVSNENAAISYGISLINRKVIENLDKYSDVEKELRELMEKYQTNLEELAKYYDSQIVSDYIKLYIEELKKINLQKNIYYLLKDEKKAKEKVDNSDDEIRENICDLEDELSKVEIRIRRIKTIIKKRISEKEEALNKAIESKETEIQKDTIKGPRIFSKATRFFLGKIKPYKLIEKNVFTSLKNRLEAYENEEKKEKKINEKYLEENIISTLDEIVDEE